MIIIKDLVLYIGIKLDYRAYSVAQDGATRPLRPVSTAKKESLHEHDSIRHIEILKNALEEQERRLDTASATRREDLASRESAHLTPQPRPNIKKVLNNVENCVNNCNLFLLKLVLLDF